MRQSSCQRTYADKVLMLVAGAILLAPAVVFAAANGHADSGAILKDFIYRCINFAIMVGLLAYFVTKPIRKGLKERRQEIAKTLEDAESARQAAEARYQEYQEKLAQATEEIAGLAEAIKRDGEVERERILAAAKEQASKIERDAENKAAGMIARARAELREEASRLAVELAENLLKEKITAADQERLVDEYMQKVGELH